MLVRKLEELFYTENAHLVEVMDKDRATGGWAEDKTRGYGIVVIDMQSLRFGIPLRSNIPRGNKHSFITKQFRDTRKGVEVRKGLDFTKAVLLVRDDYVSNVTFQIPVDELKILRDNEYIIGQKFEKYVVQYVEHTKSGTRASMLAREYGYSTLKNYHPELGIGVAPATQVE